MRATSSPASAPADVADGADAAPVRTANPVRTARAAAPSPPKPATSDTWLVPASTPVLSPAGACTSAAWYAAPKGSNPDVVGGIAEGSTAGSFTGNRDWIVAIRER